MRVIGCRARRIAFLIFPHIFLLDTQMSIMFSRLILFVLLAVLPGPVRVTPVHTHLRAFCLAKLARQHRGACENTEGRNVNWERCVQVVFSTKGNHCPLYHCYFSSCYVGISVSHTHVSTHRHTPQSPLFLWVKLLVSTATDFQQRRNLHPPPPQDEIDSKTILLISLSFELWLTS